MKKIFILTLFAFGTALVVSADDVKPAASAATLPPASTKTGVTFATDIKPIFDAACVKCHDGTKKPRAGLALDTLAGTLKGGKDGKVVTVGDSAKSDLVLSVAHIGDDPDAFMPKGKGAKKLTDDQIGLIRAWIDQGAK
ncbi:MAG TPA: c-type cytochrome domain-containing protein [Verrucomicrobiae bacterium]|jgi:mono/diheme cytochrome c family protein|nr:c-type cytochrome domain-containing protein [Verrucomicrobiae bacterium]